MTPELRRPARVAVSAVLLWVVAAVVALVGLAGTLFSNCCGSPDPPDSGPALIGSLVAGVYVVAGTCLWTGRPNRLFVAVLTGVLPVVHGVVSASSVDAAAIFLPVLAAWAGLCVLLRSGATARWFDAQPGSTSASAS